ncbi:MAG: glycosyltransferase [Acidimicrobiia bacterium]
MSRVIFVTTELHPETPGGAGVVVDALARMLGRDRESVVLLLTTQPVVVVDRPGVEVVARRLPERGFMRRSEAVAKAVAEVAEPGDLVEFHDFEGIAYLALAHRGDLGLERTTLTVRLHGPYDLLSEAMEVPPEDWGHPIAMEREVFRMADAVVIPVEGHRRHVIERYQLDPGRVRVGPPPVPPLTRANGSPGLTPVFAVIGRLGEMKGSQDMVKAATMLLAEGARLQVRFIGGEGWSTTSRSEMRPWLESMIGPEHAARFAFTGQVERDRLPDLTSDVTAVAVPSRFESFCLAAHEARMMGHPVIVPDLPAFESLFTEETGALVYDGTVDGLAYSMRRILDDAGLAERLAAAPPPVVGDPLTVYQDRPEPRHPRAQAGLATAATQRVSAAWEASRPHQGDSWLQTLYRLVPDGLARVLTRAPQGLKDRVRARASWPLEAERRARRQRLEEVDRRIAAGEFPDLGDPEVTVVIPVHDDVGFLPETLASVYEQTHPSWEIIVVDDGSTDPEAVAFLDGLRRPRLRLIRQENMGLPGARNTGMRASKAKYLVPLDSDDQLEPEFLSRTIPALEAHPQAAYAHCYARLHHDIDAYWVTRPFNPYWQLLGNGVVGCVLLRREAWEAVGGYDETMTLGNEDWELWLRLMSGRWGQVQVPDALFRYRKHGVSMSVSTEARFEEGRRLVRDRHLHLYQTDRLQRFKRRWYPLVTVLADRPGEEDDREYVSGVEELGAGWGKYVIDVRGVDPEPVATIAALADALESQPKAARAVTAGLPPLVMVRRWNLHDRGATPDRAVVIEDPLVGPEPTVPDHLPRAGWEVPPHLTDSGVAVQRQPPEEDGRLPHADSW